MASRKTVFIFLMGTSVGFLPFLLTVMNNFSSMEYKIRDDKINIVESDSSKHMQYLNRQNYEQDGEGQERRSIESNPIMPTYATVPETTRTPANNGNNLLQRTRRQTDIVNEIADWANIQLESKTTILPKINPNKLITRTNLLKRWHDLEQDSDQKPQRNDHDDRVSNTPTSNSGKDVAEQTDDEQYDYQEVSVDETEVDDFFSKFQDGATGSQKRKILFDCGGNMASTVELFRETYPGGRDFIIHSFEIDSRLAPYFAPYPNHELHCPVGVASKNGTMTAYTETAWSPTRGKDNGRDVQWGGGSLFVSKSEATNNKTGGKRQLGVRPTIPVIDLSSWIQTHSTIDDYVIFKLDVEGAEYDILKKMLSDGTFAWIDKYYGEFHNSQPVEGWTTKQKENLQKTEMKKSGLHMLNWVGERRNYQDFVEIHPVKVPLQSPGIPGGTYSNCGHVAKQVALAIAVGMNAKRARALVDVIRAYTTQIPVTLFVYGDFAELFSDDVKHWANRFHIGMREDSHFPEGHFERLQANWVRESLVSAELRLQELGVQPSYYLPVNPTRTIVNEARKRGFRVINSTYEFPPKTGITLENGNYYKYRDVERIPKALLSVHQGLFVESQGGFLVLDSDLPDTRMNSVFLLDYLIENSGYNLVSVADCVESSIAAKNKPYGA